MGITLATLSACCDTSARHSCILLHSDSVVCRLACHRVMRSVEVHGDVCRMAIGRQCDMRRCKELVKSHLHIDQQRIQRLVLVYALDAAAARQGALVIRSNVTKSENKRQKQLV